MNTETLQKEANTTQNDDVLPVNPKLTREQFNSHQEIVKQFGFSSPINSYQFELNAELIRCFDEYGGEDVQKFGSAFSDIREVYEEFNKAINEECEIHLKPIIDNLKRTGFRKYFGAVYFDDFKGNYGMNLHLQDEVREGKITVEYAINHYDFNCECLFR